MLTPFASRLSKSIPRASDADGDGVDGGRSSGTRGLFAKEDALALIARLADFTPLRLSESERVLLGVVQGALDHSEYTSNVDVSSSMHYVREAYDKDDKISAEALELCGVIVGLSVANDFKPGGGLLARPLKDNASYVASCMEIGRRFKILNPDRMRDTYGKLLFVLMDAGRSAIRRNLDFNISRQVQTVGLKLQQAGKSAMLADPAIVAATRELVAAHGESDVRDKARAVQYLVDRYASDEVPAAEIRRVLSSIEDSLSFLRSNREPVEQMIEYLLRFWTDDEPKDFELSLSLQGRRVKPRHELNHNHRQQFTFVLQSLCLWREVMSQFFRLWFGAEADLLDPANGYSLTNTGQGMNRCQGAPQTRRNMNAVLSTVQQQVGRGGWVGLQVVHLGDREVPNALVFIDKYVQVPRIFNPVVRCLRAVEGELAADAHTLAFLNKNFGGPEQCVRHILADLFRGGFDGGGDLGGSCIDGRLTSLWNWSSLIEKKDYYPVFLMSGFLGFDGDWS